jgi:PAS domain S-box-containing protein
MLAASLEQVVAHGSAAADYVARRKDGSLIEVETRTSGINVGGRFCLVVVGQDITHRKRAEQALRQSEETLRVFLDAIPTPAFLLDRDAAILLSNKALTRSLGLPEGKLAGQSVFGLLPPEVAATRKAMFDQVVLTRKPARYEDVRAGRDFLTFESPVLDAAGNVTRVAVFSLDISERKQAESALAKQEALYRTLFELSPDGIVLEDTDGNILDANQAICRSFGYSREALLHQNIRWFVPPEHQGEVATHLAALRSGQSLEHEVWNVRRSGERCLMRLNEKLLALPNGRQGILVVARDITQSKRAEMTKEVFLTLGAKLSSVRTPLEAARAVYSSADQLWQWDAASLSLYYQESDVIEPVLFCDVMDGHRRELAPPFPPGLPTSQRRRVLREGADLILRKESDLSRLDTVRFGDVSRPSASIMYVPMRREGQPVGVLSIQSYTMDAYSQEDLRTLQALADYCAGAVERIRTEQALQQREALNHSIVSTAMDGFFTLDFATDPGGVLVEVNDAYCRLLGYSREELLRMRIADLETVESPEDVTRHKTAIMAAGADRFETRHRRKDGQEIQVEISVCRLEGSNERVFGFVRDITERKRAEAALREAHHLLERHVEERTAELRAANEALRRTNAILQAINQWTDNLICLKNTQGKIIMANPAMSRFLGKAESEIIGTDDLDSLPDQHQAAQIRENDLRIMTTGCSETVEESIDQPNRRWHCLFTKSPYRDENGKITGLIGIGADITARKRAEEALREAHDTLEARVQERTAELQAANAALTESEERYRSLVTNLNVGVYRNTPGPHGRFLHANPALARMHGYESVQEFQKVNVSDLYQVPEDRKAFVADLLRQGSVVNYEVRLKKRDGTPIYGSVSAAVHRSPDGEVDYVDGVIEDITERKKAEQTLAEALELNRTLISASTVGIAAYQASGQCILANEALARITGGTVESLRQQNFRRLKSWRAAGLLAAAEAALKAAQPKQLEAESRTSFGRELTINVRFAPFVSRGEQHLLVMVTDETEAQRAQQALRASEERYRALAESSPDAIFILDRDIKVQYINSAAARLWGRRPEELIGLTQPELFPPEAAHRHCKVVAGVFETGQPVRRDEPITFPTGDQWIEIRLVPLHGEQGGVSSVMGVCSDITERKRAERQLAEALDLNQKIIAASTTGIAAYKASGECVLANEALARTTGGSVSQLLQGNFRRLDAWQKAGLLELAEEALSQGEARQAEARVTTSFGKAVHMDCRLAPFSSNGQPHLLLMALDITERKRAEGALKQAERLQRAILDNIPDAAWLKDAEGRFLACNQAIATFYGRPVKALLGKTVLDCNPAEDTRAADEDKQVMATRRSVMVEAPLTDAQGRLRWLESIKSPLFNERDEVIGTVGIARDVTERHVLERQILEISDREQARIGQDIHDGLCQQLVSLAFDANSLRTELSDRRMPEAKQARRIADCLDQAITESRQLSRGLFPVRLETEGLPSALEELAKAACARFEIQCRFDCEGSVALKNAVVATHLYRIAQEALTNAVKHSHARKVSIRLKAGANQLELRVEDDGAGLSAVKRKEATGMGLHIMAYRARAIGGTLDLGAGPRSGTVVSCCIPCGSG